MATSIVHAEPAPAAIVVAGRALAPAGLRAPVLAALGGAIGGDDGAERRQELLVRAADGRLLACIVDAPAPWPAGAAVRLDRQRGCLPGDAAARPAHIAGMDAIR